MAEVGHACKVCNCTAYVKTPGIVGICKGCKHQRSSHSDNFKNKSTNSKLTKVTLGCDRCKCKAFTKTPGLPKVCLTCSHSSASHHIEQTRGHVGLQARLSTQVAVAAGGDYNNCDICTQPITEKNGPEVPCNGVFFHQDCFICDVCHQHLTDKNNEFICDTWLCGKHFRIKLQLLDAPKNDWEVGAAKAQVAVSRYCKKCGYDNPQGIFKCQRCGKENFVEQKDESEESSEKWFPCLAGLDFKQVVGLRKQFKEMNKEKISQEEFLTIAKGNIKSEKVFLEQSCKKVFEFYGKDTIDEAEYLEAYSKLVLMM